MELAKRVIGCSRLAALLTLIPVKLYLAIIALGLSILVSGCGVPTERMVVIDFLRDHPSATVVSAGAGEGDSDNVYFHIHYRLSENSHMRTEVWLYQRELETGKWRTAIKGLPN